AGSGPPLLAASQAVGEAQKIIIRAPVGDLGTMIDPLQAIALASGVRTRNVLLAGKWWAEQNGPILAYTASDRRPVALLPVRPAVVAQVFDGSQYVLVDPTEGS